MEYITVNNVKYKMLGKAEIRQETLPGHSEATAYASRLCVKADETPDEAGTLALYECKYVLLDPEDYESGPEWYNNVDWDSPDDIAEYPYRWLETEQRVV